MLLTLDKSFKASRTSWACVSTDSSRKRCALKKSAQITKGSGVNGWTLGSFSRVCVLMAGRVCICEEKSESGADAKEGKGEGGAGKRESVCQDSL